MKECSARNVWAAVRQSLSGHLLCLRPTPDCPPSHDSPNDESLNLTTSTTGITLVLARRDPPTSLPPADPSSLSTAQQQCTSPPPPPDGLPLDLALLVCSFLPPNAIACSARLTCRDARLRFSSPSHRTVRLWQPVPPHAFAWRHGRAAQPDPLKRLSWRSKLQLLQLTAATGVVENLAVLLERGGGRLWGSRVELGHGRGKGQGQEPAPEGDDADPGPCAATAAAQHGHMHAARWILGQGYVSPDPAALVAAFLQHGCAADADWLLSQQRYSRWAGSAAALAGAAASATADARHKMERLLSAGALPDTRALAAAARGGDVCTVALLWGCSEQRGLTLAGREHVVACAAAEGGARGLIQWLHVRGALTDGCLPHACEAAAAGGQVAMLRWLLAMVLCPLGTPLARPQYDALLADDCECDWEREPDEDCGHDNDGKGATGDVAPPEAHAELLQRCLTAAARGLRDGTARSEGAALGAMRLLRRLGGRPAEAAFAHAVSSRCVPAARWLWRRGFEGQAPHWRHLVLAAAPAGSASRNGGGGIAAGYALNRHAAPAAAWQHDADAGGGATAAILAMWGFLWNEAEVRWNGVRAHMGPLVSAVVAAGSAAVPLIAWLHQRRFFWHGCMHTALRGAAHSGAVDVLEELYRCRLVLAGDLDEGTFARAAEGGCEAVLVWLAGQGCPMCRLGELAQDAASRGDSDTARCLAALGERMAERKMSDEGVGRGWVGGLAACVGCAGLRRR